MARFLTTAVLALSFVACDDASPGAGNPPAPRVSASAAGTTPARPVKATPPSTKDRPTTSASIAVGNLAAQIRGAQKLVLERKRDLEARSQLVALLGVRYRHASDMTDLERIAEIGEAAVEDQPHAGKAFQLRATSRSALHRFEEALADLDEAVKLGVGAADTRLLRASILHALGRYDEALAVKEKLAKESPTLSSLASLALLYGDMGRFDDAEQKLGEALQSYRDVSPFPVCDVLFQWGSILEKTGETARAREFLAAAVERLPAFAHAKAHLARLEPQAKGLALLGSVDPEKDDPEIVAQLSELQQALGKPADAKRARDIARTRYEELGKRHPAAFADHIARFYLVTDPHGKNALSWAEKNLEVRQTPDAYQLVVDAALSFKKHDRACEAARQGSKHPYATGSFQLSAARAFDACDDKKAANEARASARKHAVIRR